MILKIIFLPMQLFIFCASYCRGRFSLSNRLDTFSLFLMQQSFSWIKGIFAYRLFEKKKFKEVLLLYRQGDLKNSSGLFLLSIALSRRATGKVNDRTIGLLVVAAERGAKLLKNYYLFKLIATLRETRRMTASELRTFDSEMASVGLLYKNFYYRACLELASEFLQQDKVDEAEKWYQIGRLSPGASAGYLALTHYFDPSSAHSEVDRLVSPGISLIDIVKMSQGSICVVGNSPSVIGANVGKWIDAQRVVIRFNNYSLGPEFIDDIGSKTDVWVRMLPTPLIDRTLQPGVSLVVFTGPNSIYRSIPKWPEVLEISSQVESTDFFDEKLFFELQSMIGSPPSSGLMTCYTIYRVLGYFPKYSMIGLSIDGNVEEEGVYHYSDPMAFAAPRHNWKKEAAVYKKLLLGVL
ncbi:MAG: glycosyltransferase family 29 protein [Halomonas sp.]|nr:glycosyltransferase family 29 protein [Halomonas sp.]